MSIFSLETCLPTALELLSRSSGTSVRRRFVQLTTSDYSPFVVDVGTPGA
jgi:hypothetical protein